MVVLADMQIPAPLSVELSCVTQTHDARRFRHRGHLEAANRDGDRSDGGDGDVDGDDSVESGAEAEAGAVWWKAKDKKSGVNHSSRSRWGGVLDGDDDNDNGDVEQDEEISQRSQSERKVDGSSISVTAVFVTAFTRQLLVHQEDVDSAIYSSSGDGNNSKVHSSPLKGIEEHATKKGGIAATDAVGALGVSPKSGVVSSFADPSTSLSLIMTTALSTLPRSSPLLLQMDNTGALTRTNLSHSSSSSSSSGRTSPKPAASSALSWESPGKTMTGKLVDQPVTFHHRIASSGYGQHSNDPLVRMQQQRQKRLQASAAARTLQKQQQQQIPLDRSTSAPLSTSTKKNENVDSSVRSARNTRDRAGTAGTSAAAAGGGRIRAYPVTCAPMTLHQPHNDYSTAVAAASSSATVKASMTGTEVSPISSIAFNDDASLLCFASADSTVSTLRLPVSRHCAAGGGGGGGGHAYMGHNGRITAVCFSHNKRLLLSASTDGTARVWTLGKVEAASVIFSHSKHQPSGLQSGRGAVMLLSNGSSASTSASGYASSMATHTKTATGGSFAAAPSTKSILSRNVNTSAPLLSSGKEKGSTAESRNKPFGAEITNARFYFQDKFVCLVRNSICFLVKYFYILGVVFGQSFKSTLGMYVYTVEGVDSKSSDVKKLQACGKYHVSHQWCLDAHSITAFSCANTVNSSFIFCATSDRLGCMLSLFTLLSLYSSFSSLNFQHHEQKTVGPGRGVWRRGSRGDWSTRPQHPQHRPRSALPALSGGGGQLQPLRHCSHGQRGGVVGHTSSSVRGSLHATCQQVRRNRR